MTKINFLFLEGRVHEQSDGGLQWWTRLYMDNVTRNATFDERTFGVLPFEHFDSIGRHDVRTRLRSYAQFCRRKCNKLIFFIDNFIAIIDFFYFR